MFFKFIKILDKKDKIKFSFILFLVLFTLIIEVFSISSIFPLLIFLTNFENVEKYQILKDIINYLQISEQKELILYSVIFIVTTYIFKIFFNLFTVNYMYYFAYQLQKKITNRLFSYYLSRPLLFFMNTNSSKLIRNISIEITLFTQNYIMPVLNLFAETIIILGIISLLLLIELKGAIIVSIILLLSVIFLVYLNKNKTAYWAKVRQEKENERVKILQQSLSIISELKILGRERQILTDFFKSSKLISNSAKVQAVLLEFPRIFMEFIAIISFCVLLLFLNYFSEFPELLLPTIGVFCAAAFRLLPMSNRFLTSIQRIKFSIPITKFVIKEFETILKTNEKEMNLVNDNKKMNFKNKITLKGVNYKYPDQESSVLENLNLEIKKGEIIGIMGLSGSGKTTLLRILAGLINPKDGKISCDEKNINEDLKSWQNILGYVPQSTYLVDDSIKNNIAFAINSEVIDLERIKSCAKIAQVHSFISNLPNQYETIVGENGIKLSGGQKQRIGVARALYHDPEIIIFDEATSSIDTETEDKFYDSIDNLKSDKTVIIVSHRSKNLDICEKTYHLENKKLIQDK